MTTGTGGAGGEEAAGGRSEQKAGGVMTAVNTTLSRVTAMRETHLQLLILLILSQSQYTAQDDRCAVYTLDVDIQTSTLSVVKGKETRRAGWLAII